MASYLNVAQIESIGDSVTSATHVPSVVFATRRQMSSAHSESFEHAVPAARRGVHFALEKGIVDPGHVRPATHGASHSWHPCPSMRRTTHVDDCESQ